MSDSLTIPGMGTPTVSSDATTLAEGFSPEQIRTPEQDEKMFADTDADAEEVASDPQLAAVAPLVKKVFNRDAIRTAILAAKPQVAYAECFGVSVELHQPSLEEILSIQAEAATDNKASLVGMIIMYTYVPDSNEKVFTEEDRAGLLAVPFGPDMSALISGFQKLTGVNVTAADKS